ncbi:MAG TPA: response regulator [Rhodothermales bacterium]
MTTQMRILLVEDSLQDVELILSALDQLASDVLAVPDGAEALDYLYRRGRFQGRETGHPAVVLLDLKLPKVSGLDVLRQLKSDAELRRIPVVMLTSSREEQDLMASYNLGVNAFVVKSVDFEEFCRAIRELGLFWLEVNEPPPSTMRPVGR